jgi:hypothetical protein
VVDGGGYARSEMSKTDVVLKCETVEVYNEDDAI